MNARPCKLCGTPILMLTDPNGKVIPLNKTRVRTYHVNPYSVGEDESVEGDCLYDDNDSPQLSFLSHFLTCDGVRKPS